MITVKIKVRTLRNLKKKEKNALLIKFFQEIMT